MSVAVGVQHELQAALDSGHLSRVYFFNEYLTKFFISGLDYRFHKVTHYLLLVLLVFAVLRYDLNNFS